MCVCAAVGARGEGVGVWSVDRCRACLQLGTSSETGASEIPEVQQHRARMEAVCALLDRAIADYPNLHQTLIRNENASAEDGEFPPLRTGGAEERFSKGV